MFGIFDIIKIVGIVGALGGGFFLLNKYGIYQKSEVEGYQLTISRMEMQIEKLENDLQQCVDANAQLVANEQFLKDNLASLEEEAEEQLKQIENLREKSADAQAKVDALEDVFNSHDFNSLVERRPGILEQRINAGTRRALNDLQELTRKPETDNE